MGNIFRQQLLAFVKGDAPSLAIVGQLCLVDSSNREVASLRMTDEEAAEYWAEIYCAVFFNYSHYCLNRLAAADGIPVYEYLFTKKNKSLSSWHSGELRYAFHNIPEKTRLYDDADRHVSDVMHSYWVNFAKTGDPNGAGLPVFEQNRGSDMVLELGDVIGMRHEPYLAFYEIMDEMQDFEPEIL